MGRLLPREVLSASEVERVSAQPNTRTRLGLRDRTILEVLYSTGSRRLELRNLSFSDLHLDRCVVLVREGQGQEGPLRPNRDACSVLATPGKSNTLYLSRL